jgi:hypothetical protein
MEWNDQNFQMFTDKNEKSEIVNTCYNLLAMVKKKFPYLKLEFSEIREIRAVINAIYTISICEKSQPVLCQMEVRKNNHYMQSISKWYGITGSERMIYHA